jgi:hypothetical protein
MILPSLLRLGSARPASASPTRLESGSQALHRLMRDRSKPLWDSLQDTVEAASQLCETDCAGITRREPPPEGLDTLRWIATTGPLRLAIGQSLCLDRNLRSVLRERKPRLVIHPHRLFSHIAESWHATEALLVPFTSETSERSSGILWVVQRDGSKRLDGDEIRLLTQLAAFASFTIARQEIEALRRNAVRSCAAARVAHELARAINTPLPAVPNPLHQPDNNSGQRREDARTQLRRSNTLIRVPLVGDAPHLRN